MTTAVLHPSCTSADWYCSLAPELLAHSFVTPRLASPFVAIASFGRSALNSQNSIMDIDERLSFTDTQWLVPSNDISEQPGSACFNIFYPSFCQGPICLQYYRHWTCTYGAKCEFRHILSAASAPQGPNSPPLSQQPLLLPSSSQSGAGHLLKADTVRRPDDYFLVSQHFPLVKPFSGLPGVTSPGDHEPSPKPMSYKTTLCRHFIRNKGFCSRGAECE